MHNKNEYKSINKKCKINGNETGNNQYYYTNIVL